MSEQNTPSLSPEQARRLTKMRMRMLLKMPYYGNFALGVDMVPDAKVETAVADGRKIKFNPDWLLGADDTDKVRDEGVAKLAHEILHMSFKHPLRRNHREPKMWNAACDYAVNPILKESGFTLPDKHLDNPQFHNMTAEQIYDLLEKQQQKQQRQMNGPQQKGGGGAPPPQGKMRVGNQMVDLDKNDPGQMGGVAEPENKEGTGPASQAEMAMVEAELDGKIASAAQAAKGQGKLPAGLERMLVEALKPKIDWKDRLRKFVAKTIPADFTWMRPSRRSIANGIYMPSSIKNGCGKILVVIDTSGSIGNEELAQYWGEVTSIFEDCNPEQLVVMYCDAAVAGIDFFSFGETPVLKPRGGGGTDFRPPFRKVDKDGIQIQCAIYLTDGYGSFPEKEPPYPVLWVITTDVKSPHGETLRLEL
jgi:predicted metal-dependent peptidase